MKTISERKFGIVDGLLIVAASATGFAATHTMTPNINIYTIWNAYLNSSKGGMSFRLVAATFAEFGTFLIMPTLMAWTTACLLLRLRFPRPSGRKIVRQPGAMASLVTTTAIVCSLGVTVVAFTIARPDRSHRIQNLYNAISFASLQTGAAVLWCWATMLISGQWRPEPTWIDRLGRCAGFTWIAMAAMYAYVQLKLLAN